MQNATSEDRCMRGTAYRPNDDRISQKKIIIIKKKKKKKKKGGGSLIRACSLIRSNTVHRPHIEVGKDTGKKKSVTSFAAEIIDVTRDFYYSHTVPMLA